MAGYHSISKSWRIWGNTICFLKHVRWIQLWVCYKSSCRVWVQSSTFPKFSCGPWFVSWISLTPLPRNQGKDGKGDTAARKSFCNPSVFKWEGIPIKMGMQVTVKQEMSCSLIPVFLLEMSENMGNKIQTLKWEALEMPPEMQSHLGAGASCSLCLAAPHKSHPASPKKTHGRHAQSHRTLF